VIANRDLEKERLVLGPHGAGIAVDDQHPQAARRLDPTGPPVVEREAVRVDHHLCLMGAAHARDVVDEALAGPPACRHVDEAARHLVPV
jgi:hypothetical protein